MRLQLDDFKLYESAFLDALVNVSAGAADRYFREELGVVTSNTKIARCGSVRFVVLAAAMLWAATTHSNPVLTTVVPGSFVCQAISTCFGN